jgi:hypothetical protein
MLLWHIHPTNGIIPIPEQVIPEVVERDTMHLTDPSIFLLK